MKSLLLRYAPVFLFLFSVAACAGSLFFFHASASYHNLAWSVYALSLGLLVSSGVFSSSSISFSENGVGRKEISLLLGAVVVAAIFRLYQITEFPFGIWFDEAQNLLESRRIMEESEYRPVYIAHLSQMPALFFYYLVPFIFVFGTEISAARFAAALAGIAAIITTWFCARVIFGKHVALCSAALLAISSWHVNFSRFGMVHILTTLFVPLILGLYIISQKRLSRKHAIFSGIALGIGMQTYYSVVSVVGILIFSFFLYAIRHGELKERVTLMILLFVSALVTFGPVMQFAYSNPDLFTQRMSTTSTVQSDMVKNLFDFERTFAERMEPWLPVLESAKKHLEMFHFHGDNNGRHNLPGDPMLDPVYGTLLMIGLMVVLVKLFRVEHFVLFLWFAAMISAGIFSLSFEAPQAARTIGLTPLLAILAGLGLNQFLSLTNTLIPRAFQTFMTVLVLAVISCFSWDKYFHKQRFDTAVWGAFSTAETKIGQLSREYGDQATLYVPGYWLGGPTYSLLAGERQLIEFDRARHLPLPDNEKDAIIILPALEQQVLEIFKKLYPRTRIAEFGPPHPREGKFSPTLNILHVAHDDIVALQGWQTTCFDSTLENNVITSDCRIKGAINIPESGIYKIRIPTALESEVTVNHRYVKLIKDEILHVNFARGLNLIEFTILDKSRLEDMEWKSPEATGWTTISPSAIKQPHAWFGGLTGSYYKGVFEGEPVFQQIDPEIAFYFHYHPLNPPFSIRWTGFIFAAENGLYKFSTRSIDSSYLSIAGNRILDNPDSNKYVVSTMELSEGWHPIEVGFSTVGNYAQVYLYWTPPGGSKQRIPQQYLSP